MLNLIKSLLILLLLATPCFAAGQDSDTKLLLHLNGADAATSTTDATGRHGTINFDGTAELDTAFFKWGTAALLLDGDSDILNIDDSADWDVTGNYTIDLQVKHADHVGEEVYMCQYEDADNFWYLEHLDGSGLSWISYKTATIASMPHGGEITDTDWHHVAMCKVGNEYGIYLDGEQVSYLDDADTATYAGPLDIGAFSVLAGGFFQGHLDEIRIQGANIFGAAPNNVTSDVIVVPIVEYSEAGAGGRRFPKQVVFID